MKFLSSIAVLALAASVNASVRPTGTDSRCCWGGKAGSDACLRQNGYVGCVNGRENDNFCSSHGIDSSRCVSPHTLHCPLKHPSAWRPQPR
ncbi:hypothetical protein CMUS01_14212 [Colletotrichum musicola]|uniref:Uncharacterized protein n=1 Tax=Colletotrichum musicola TaxID=2175873 RepID=A0A8H6MS39_9PEZI|nr:hypothetical protein CMUS01_14212 [Colletotrichum musicola]